MTQPHSQDRATGRRLVSLLAAFSLMLAIAPSHVAAVANPAAGYRADWTVTRPGGIPRSDGRIAIGDDLALSFAAVDGTAITSCVTRLTSVGGWLMQSASKIVAGACTLTIRLPDFPNAEHRAAFGPDAIELDLCVSVTAQFADAASRAMRTADRMQPGDRACYNGSDHGDTNVLDFPIEPGGTPRAFVSDPPVVSWNPSDWGTGMGPLTFGSDWHYQAPAWADFCQGYLNGSWQTVVRPARNTDCQPWDVRLPGVLPSTLPWSGDAGDWDFELVTEYTSAGGGVGSQTITEMHTPIAPSDTVFESSQPAIFPVDLAPARFVTEGQPWRPVFQLSGGSETACTLDVYTNLPGNVSHDDYYHAVADSEGRCTFDVPAFPADAWHQYFVTAGDSGGMTFAATITAIPAPEPPTIEPPVEGTDGGTDIGVDPGDGQGLGLEVVVVPTGVSAPALAALVPTCHDSVLSTDLTNGGAIPHLDANCPLAKGTYRATARMVDAAGVVTTSTRNFSVAGPPIGETYHPITPLRVLDTRHAVGLSGGFLTNVPRTFNVAGTGAIPANATAITGNLTVVGQSSTGYMSVGPTITSTPTSSTVNFPFGDDRANNLTLPLNASGDLMAVFKGLPDRQTQLILDVTGYFLADDAGATYKPITPARVLDTRIGKGLAGKFNVNAPRTFQVTGVGGVPAGAKAVTGNLTVVGQSKAGYVSLTPAPVANPATSTINFPLGDTRANGVTVPLSAAGKLSAVYKASSGSTNLIFDVTGYYLDGTSGLRFYPLSPRRIMDTRLTSGTQLAGRFSSSMPRVLVTGGHAGIPDDAAAVTGNLTVTGQTKAGYVSITKAPTSAPPVSTLNFPLGDVRANGVTVPLNGTNDMALVYKATSGATTNLILDLTGYFR